MGGSKQKKNNKQKRKKLMEEEKPNKKKRNNISGAAPNQPQPSLASRLKKVRGTADSTPLPPEWSRNTSKSFLSPSDGSLFDSCKRECYRGFCWEDPHKLPPTLHVQFDQAFDALYEAGLFLHDAVQPGGKRLSRTFVSRTVIGNPGSTYRYLGLRLFSHPWSSTSNENDSTTTDGIQSLTSLGYTHECASALVTIRILNEQLKKRTQHMLQDEIAPHVELVGSADYSLSLINRMEPTSLKKDLKPDKDYGMGKTSVSWHKDSGLADFSSIAVYHSLRDTTNEESSDVRNPWKVAVRVADTTKQTTTPPLSVPLASGTLYYLLDDFNHKHEHTVVAGSNQLRYSSTHRVAREGRGTWHYIREKCRNVLGVTKENEQGSLSERRKRLVKATRLQQQLMDEIENEWLRQWYIQGKLHAKLHPYWHKPIQQLEEWFVELELGTVKTIELLQESCSKKKQTSQAESLVSQDLFDVLIEAMEERQKTRTTWLERLEDPLFATMDEMEQPFSSKVLDRVSFDATRNLPENLTPLVANLRKYRRKFVKHAQKGHGSNAQYSNLTKRERKTIASNWESMKASFGNKK
eukprot:CAMPEP_0202493574 /NCGR_PEP_ID=MMETSP1361-20130828/9866_1 /ASSEMBLY_ACC=CAM_ASM_000849 /TAXON_ID=210615 /ORGANISM="Staurosira complex sp., Strain CCMP2646" /LENGTH=578 /DNA_ID=CAMNT_0049123911 /DNA_START=57 /DNA_END=1793 /DNA_ORIENTATION=-